MAEERRPQHDDDDGSEKIVRIGLMIRFETGLAFRRWSGFLGSDEMP